MRLPKVSIVTPSFNQGEFLEETMLSVLNQNYPNLEYIVVDGGSTDGSIDIIKKYENRLAWWVSEPDNGQSDAINKGFLRATGEIFNWVNSDDLICPGAVRMAVHFLEKESAVELVFGDRLVIDRASTVIEAYEAPSYSDWFPPLLAKLPQEAAFFTANIWKKVGGLDTSLDYVMDTDLWYRFREHTRFFHIPMFLGMYRKHLQSKSVFGMGSAQKLNDKAASEFKARQKKYGNFLSAGSSLQKTMGFLNQVRLVYEKNRRFRRLLKEEAYRIGFDVE
ncbi:glycosyltransferase family 2 protein [Marinilabilia sp.]|uniref:glycosyltransferase family 2 protein n=1 Tax=Marinilabilia sp. TaxID=2021252 RepID=UPI0025BD5F7D|nr:glycosyltransferase family 2 protein [Marinilabilia sp.]